MARLFKEGKLKAGPRTPQVVADLIEPAAFARLKNALYEKDWVVFAKAPFRTPDALFQYLGLYTHRVAISNQRLLHVDDNEVVFRTRDKKVCRLVILEFIRRLLLHVLPRGFVKIRHFGLYAAGNVNSKLAAARTAIENRNHPPSESSQPPTALPAQEIDVPDWRALFQKLTGIDLGTCSSCGGPMLSLPLADTRPSARAPPLDSS